MEYFSPGLLAWAAVYMAVVLAIYDLLPGVGLRRWYQIAMLSAWVLVSGTLVLTFVRSSPWALLGAVLVLPAAGVVITVYRRLNVNMEEEALNFLQMLCGVMANGQSVEQALRQAAYSSDFAKTFPRMTAQVREVISRKDSGHHLSQSIAEVQESVHRSARQVWEKLESLAKLCEGEGDKLPVNAQYDALLNMWQILFDVHNIQRDLKREMTSVEMAKWIFVVIMPGMNVYQAFMVSGYISKFLLTPVGMLVLGIEASAILSIFFIFSRLQKLPEVRV